MRYRLRTLMIVLALGPMVLWAAYAVYDELRLRAMDGDLSHYIEGSSDPVEHPDPIAPEASDHPSTDNRR